MALKIRLRRMGRKKAPTYRIVVAESTMPRDGRFVAAIGHYNPRTEPIVLVVDRDKALHWLSQGATPTDTAKSLLKRAGVFGPAPAVTEGEGVVGNLRAAARKVTGRVRAAAAGAGAKVADVVEDAVEEVRETAEEVVEEVREKVEELREKVGRRGDGADAAESAAPVEAAAAESEPAGEEAKAAPAAE